MNKILTRIIKNEPSDFCAMIEQLQQSSPTVKAGLFCCFILVEDKQVDVHQAHTILGAN